MGFFGELMAQKNFEDSYKGKLLFIALIPVFFPGKILIIISSNIPKFW